MNYDIYKLTPIEEHGGMSFKREDKFAPNGYGGINGSKLRQCIHLIDKWHEQGYVGVVSGGVSESPQHAFISAVCKDYGMGCVIVTAKDDISKSKYLKIAQRNGAVFQKSKVGYAKSLNAQAKKLLERLPNHKLLEVNITLDSRFNNYEDIKAFHEAGAYQTQNIPASIDTIIIPCGSCNSVTSVLYGLMKYKIDNIKKVVLLGIGNNGSNNIDYVNKRLRNICKQGTGIDYDSFYDWSFRGNIRKKIQLDYYNLNGTGYCQYSDLMPATVGGINFHPRYEGKCINYLQEHKLLTDAYWKPSTLFWVVGSDIQP